LADEIEMDTLEEAPFLGFGGEVVATLVHVIDPREELRVHGDCAVVRGELRRDVALDGLQVA
jgi:hypothetical protein